MKETVKKVQPNLNFQKRMQKVRYRGFGHDSMMKEFVTLDEAQSVRKK